MALEGRVLLDPAAGWNPDWLKSPQSNKLIAALGQENVRFVGGCVRDSFLGRDVADIDLATTHEPTETTKLLEAVGVKVVPTGLTHGTVTAIVDGLNFEITSLRSDVSTDGRHATVAFTKDWLQDAHRRDFTINALYASSDGKIFDPFGGVDDLRNHRVRFIGDAEERIKEDALRIYRFFRFSARFGASLDAKGLAACEHRASDVKNLSRERVRDELLKLLSVDDPRPFLREMQRIQILPRVGEARADLSDLNKEIERELENECQSSPETRLALLYADGNTKAISSAFRLSRKQELLIRDVRCVRSGLLEEAPVRPLLYQFGTAIVEEALSGFNSHERDKFLQEINDWEAPEFPLSGADLLEAGYQPTPELGERLKLLEQAWIESDFKMTKDELLTTIGLA